MERADLVQLVHTLQQLQTCTAAEVAAARAAWPPLAGGLPNSVAPALRTEVATAERRAAALTLPAEVTTEGGLTGPAAELAGMLKSYVRLTQRGWQYLTGALAAGRNGKRAASARFLHANAPLYIYSVYDGHYHLSLIGKTLQSAYLELGGAPEFGASLTQSQVGALASAYSIPATRLTPHPAPGVVV